MATPEVAVVVATRNRRDRVLRLLDALEDQRDAPAFEVVLVDDASNDGTWDAVHERASTSPIPLKVLRMPAQAGPGAARNAGWRAASAALIAFTDDDCVPDPAWLRELAVAARSADIVQGATHADPERIGLAGPWTEIINLPHGTPFFETCNVAYRRQTLERVGGFDARFRHAGEDIDLSQRALSQGATHAFASGARVTHDVVPWSLGDRFQNMRTRFDDVPRTIAHHPQLRPMLHHRVWFRRAHEPAALACAGVLAAIATPRVPLLARLGIAGLAATPYVRFRLRSGRLAASRRRNAALVPVALAVDVAEVALLARSSVRHRALVL